MEVIEFVQFIASGFIARLEKPKSSLGYKYPTLRDHPLHTSEIWLRGKQADDGAEGLWRLYDGLYDFTKFIKDHPGGSDWLEITKGIDITEIFEAHHISTKPEKFLQNYFVRKATQPSNSPFTFEEDGFYRTLKRRVRKELDDIPKHPEARSKIMADILLLAFMITSILAIKLKSTGVAFVSGLLLSLTSIAAHNFFHQRNNFRMYYFDFIMMSSRSWRISHALSHHIYTNTIYDLEISALEPFLQYLPMRKNFWTRNFAWIYVPFFCAFACLGHYLKTIIQAILERTPPRLEDYVPIIHLFFLYQCGGQTLKTTIYYYMLIEIVGSFFFTFQGIGAAHHHPDLFHDGDENKASPKIDWGLHQLDAVMDKPEVTGSHFLVLVNYGEHGLHHLFPTLDHGRLKYLYPIFKEVCQEFDIEIKIGTQLSLIHGQFQRLSKVDPRKIKTS